MKNCQGLKQLPGEQGVFLNNFNDTNDVAPLSKQDVVHLGNRELAVSFHYDVRLNDLVVFGVYDINF